MRGRVFETNTGRFIDVQIRHDYLRYVLFKAFYYISEINTNVNNNAVNIYIYKIYK